MNPVSRRLSVSLVGVLAFVVLLYTPMPGLRAHLMDAISGDTRPFSVACIAMAPWVTAHILVELACLVRREWREARLSGPTRPGIDRAVVVVWLVVALIQATSMVSGITQMSLGGSSLIASDPGTRTLLVASLVGASACAGLLARLMTAYGIGVGFAWLVCVEPGLDLWDSLRTAAPMLSSDQSGVLLALVTAVAAGALTVTFLRQRGVSGVPLVVAGAVTVWLGRALHNVTTLAPRLGAPEAVVQRDVWRGVALNTAFVWAILAYYAYAVHYHLTIIDLGYIALLVATTADVLAEVRARHTGQTSVVWTVHRVQDAIVAQRCLAQAGIPCTLRGSRFRQLLHLFAPYVPIGLLVDPNHEEAATAALRAQSR